MGRRASGGGVRPKGDRIAVRFTYKGQDIQPTLELKPTAPNLKHAARLRLDILEELKAGTFRLSAYFPDYKFADRYVDENDSSGRTLRDWADVWKKHADRELEKSTVRIYWRHLEAYWLSVFGGMLPRSVSHEMILNRLSDLATDRVDPERGKVKGLGRKTQNNIMIPLRGVFELICKAPGAPADPTDGIDNMKVQQGDPDPFDAEEVEVALAQVRKARGGDAMADYFEFAAFAGLRPSEQIELHWEDYDRRRKEVKVWRSMVLGDTKGRTKTHKSRIVELNDRAVAVLERQRARTQLKGPLVFINPITEERYVDEQFQAREWKRALAVAGIRHRPPKELRDTSVTFNLSAGVDPYWVAAQHGHSVTTMMRDYAKFIPRADKGRNLAAINAALSTTKKEGAA